MRRRIFVFLVALGFLILGVRSFVNEVVPQNIPQGQEISFVEHGPLTPLIDPSLGELQNLVDRVSEAATKEQWITASKWVQDLEKAWQRLRVTRTGQLEIEQGISNAILTLHYNVWGKDLDGVLRSARTLTDLIGQLTA
ncbi:MAG: hypothetical protein GX956_08580 [Firmicutes bacterium]|nr:hypothetical protein [Bacillota bacterium]